MDQILKAISCLKWFYMFLWEASKLLSQAGNFPFSPISYKRILYTDATTFRSFAVSVRLIKP